ncbi:MAG: hypothetical protein JWQ20_3979 [Conexibacter sp.]|nr:hypothetical protein [Conexibacter sp.]
MRLAPAPAVERPRSASTRRGTWLWAVLTGVAVAVGSVLERAYGPGYAGYDAIWALVWGEQARSGSAPSLEAPLAPTPHPLLNALAVPLSLAPDGGEGLLVAATFVAFGALVVATGMLGFRAAGPVVGVVAAIVLATRPVLAREAAYASVDLPFLALVVGAAACAAHGRRRGALSALLAAGLLRPEAWALSIAYGAWVMRDGTSWRAAMPLALGAPALWLLTDLVFTGDPLHSLTGTRALGEELGRPTGLGTAIRALPDALTELLGGPLLIAGLLGMVVAGLRRDRRLALPAAIATLGLLSFLVLGAAGLPVLTRYLLAPACMLVVLAAAPLGGPAHRRPTAVVTAVVAAVLLVGSVPGTIDRLGDARSFTADRARAHRDLRALAGDPVVATTARDCERILAPDFRSRPVLALDLDSRPDAIEVGPLPDDADGMLFTYADEHTRYVFNLGAPGETRRQPAPTGSRLVARNRSWVAYARC